MKRTPSTGCKTCPYQGQTFRDGHCAACYQRIRRGTAVTGCECQICGVSDPRVLRRTKLRNDTYVLCANHAAIAGWKRPSLDELREWALTAA